MTLKKPKITYFIGAGASYSSCPIWTEQGNKMIEVACKYFKKNTGFFITKPTDLVEHAEEIIWDIGYFGLKANKFGTIDTYAKKLHLNASFKELSRLKLSVSVFFTIWQLTNDRNLKSRKIQDKEYVFEEIDKRYISLFASILESKSSVEIKIKENIRFVSWNYDLQLEYAFKSFNQDNLSWEFICNNLNFRAGISDNKELDICHLNGYHGFYNVKEREEHFLDLTESKGINEIVDSLSFLYNSHRNNGFSLSNHINYAWEKNPIAQKTRDEALRIFSETDILIIIGYSFPNFNKEIDKELFKRLQGRKTRIYYQDPNASLNFIKQLVDINECEVIIEKEKLDNFILPYDF
ncbi:hypothetical protein [Psychroserpens mesophilus]|uniref:hypothetical protein n=1 Tax=Psychroserpens mesophilus TaxID=325473 RepID=UPI00058DEF96|nr:hypothetical protein [Psychroserpens mesophilus]